MKQLIILLAALLVLGACGQEEEAQAPAEDQAQVETEAPEAVAEEAEAAVEEALEVVEESAAVEEESADEPIILAQADSDETAREWKFKENRDYRRLVPTQPTIGGADKIEVAVLFQYGCIHCFNLEPSINAWAANLDPAVRFVRIPSPFNRAAMIHAQLFYTAELLANNNTLEEPERFHETVFTEFHNRRNTLVSEEAIARLFARFGVDGAQFEKAWNSFYVNQKKNTAADLTRRYGNNPTPTVVVNGKFVVSNGPNLLETIDELLIREGLR